MSTPDQLKQPSQLPDDLKALLAEIKVPSTDPILPLLAWIWKQMVDTKAVLESARSSAAAVFDNRLERMNKTAEILISVDQSLQQVDEQLRSKPLQVKELVEEELAEPIQTAVESYLTPPCEQTFCVKRCVLAPINVRGVIPDWYKGRVNQIEQDHSSLRAETGVFRATIMCRGLEAR